MSYTPSEFRQQIRSRRLSGPTAGHCGDYAQANLAILPRQYADDFLRFCTLNPKACPLLGDRRTRRLAGARRSAPISTYATTSRRFTCTATANVPRRCAASTNSGATIWWCSRSAARFRSRRCCRREGIPLRHIEQKVNVPMYRTQRTQRAGRCIRRQPRGLDAADESRRRDPRHPDHQPFSRGTWRAGSIWATLR